MNEFKNLSYSSICLDAGIIGSRHFVDFVLATKGKTFPIKIIDAKNLNADGYADLGLRILQDNILDNINISAFVGDSLPAQVKGLHPKSKHSFQKRESTPLKYKKILFVPCANHRLQNAFKKTYKEDLHMKKSVDFIHFLSVKLRKPSNIDILGTICPNPIETRWLYCYEVCTFIENNKEIIKSKLNIEISDDIAILLKILAPLRSLMNVLGKETTCLPDVYPLVSKLIELLDRLDDISGWENTRDCLIRNIKYYTLNSKEGPLYLLSYALTPKGRSDLYQKQFKKEVPNEKDFIKFTEYEIPNILNSNKSNEMNSNNELDQNENNNNEQDKIVDCLIDVALDTWQNFEPSVTKNDGEYEILQGNVLQIKQTMEVHQSFFHISCSALDEILEYLLIPEKERGNTKKAFFKWMTSDHDKLPDYFLADDKNPEMIWSAIHLRDASENWNQIAEIALRLLNIPATETSCERLISIQGFIAHKRCRRANSELLNARLIHMMAKTKE